jgi:phosphoesterase RecJ-like protein
MFESFFEFLDRHQSFILTTHDSPDADGLGAQMVAAFVLRKLGKDFRIINTAPAPSYLGFLENVSIVECWDEEKPASLAEDFALIIFDAGDEYQLGSMRALLKKAKEVFVIDHHEPKNHKKFSGIINPAAASTSEIAIELAGSRGIELDPQTATAAYAGIVYDSGFFAYPKTNIGTFKAAIKTLEWGADPNHIYRQLMESASFSVILLQKQALSKLEFYSGKKIALLVLRREDFEISGADFEDAENIVNIPLKAKEVEVSLLVKEQNTGEIRCSLRSKGKINVSKVAQEFGGGGHVTAAGFRSSLSMDNVLKKLLADVEARLEK